MREVVSIREANQHLSRYLERVEQGAEIIITGRGKAIARLLPIEGQPQLSDAQHAARERLRERMNRGYALGGARVDREVLHERDRGQEPRIDEGAALQRRHQHPDLQHR